MEETELPSRYEKLTRLGQGGGGEVWAVRDRFTGREYALKLLAREAGPRELAALVREAVALSGLEGLGMPRVQRFGRLPRDGRPFMLRELVEGESLEQLVQRGAPLESLLSALARGADQLTLVHRAGFLHGDVKPGNVIVEPDGAVTFVDLGLAAPWREGGAPAEGLTPRYAAPELFEGRPLTVRAEVFALGIALAEMLGAAAGQEAAAASVRELGAVAERATAPDANERYPSVDEFAIAVRRASGLPSVQHPAESSALWPVVGIDGTSAQLVEAALALEAGQVLRLAGPPLSGRSALLRRLAWSLGAEGAPLAYVEDASASAALAAELEGHATLARVFVLVDDADALERSSFERLERARDAGARLVLVGGGRFEHARVFEVPPLDERAAIELVRRAMPSLTDTLQRRVVELAGGRPGELRRLVRLMASDAVASAEDMERRLGASADAALVPEDPLARAVYFLDRGRFIDAKAALELLAQDDRVAVAVARARLELGLGEAGRALAALKGVSGLERASESDRRRHGVYLGRAEVGVGNYPEALVILEPLSSGEDATATEALAYASLALSLLGRHDDAVARLETAASRAEALGVARVEALVYSCLGLALQRADRGEPARVAYQRAAAAAERASDAGTLAMVQLNLAGLLKIQGDIAGALELFEAAVDMGRRSAGARPLAKRS